MTPDLERAARALRQAYNANQMHHNGGLMTDDEIVLARAVLLAIREPSEGMAMAGWEAAVRDVDLEDAARVFRAGIDAILGEAK